jgi:phage terminase large subunit-like protein
MEAEGLRMVPVSQNFTTLSEPTKKLKELCLDAKIRHSANPVLKWNVDCMSVKADGHGNLKPVKPNYSTDPKRIDGAAALINALQRYLLQPFAVPSPWANEATAVM